MIGCYTFYSYKGGSGRTTALLNTVKYLIRDLGASKDRPLLLVDADLESAGLTYFFNCHNKFSGDLNTSSILSKSTTLFNKENEGVIFGDVDERNTMLVCEETEAWGELQGLDSQDTATGKKISEVFRGLRLPGKYFGLIKRIIVSMSYGEHYFDSNGRDIWSVKERLKKIDGDTSISDDQKQRMKTDVVLDFLPTRTFLEVSDYFCSEEERLPEGTVKFLGTDVSNESRLTRADAQNAIARLKKKCEAHNYCAVVFDSGAGTQTSAYILHGSSDVIVYCMRPTLQFIDGTKDNLYRFRQILQDVRKSDDSKKPVVLFPNAVPELRPEYKPFMDQSFREISRIVSICSDIVDDSFCSYDACLHEIPLFKWREKILGCMDHHLPDDVPDDLRTAVDAQSHGDTPDMEKYLRVYAELSKCLIRNT